MIRIQVELPDVLHRELMFLAKKEGTNFSSLIRESIKEVIKKRLKKRKN